MKLIQTEKHSDSQKRRFEIQTFDNDDTIIIEVYEVTSGKTELVTELGETLKKFDESDLILENNIEHKMALERIKKGIIIYTTGEIQDIIKNQKK